MKRFLLYLLAIATLVACTKGDDGESPNPEPTPEKPKAEIEIETTVLDFTAEGGENIFGFTTTEAWTAEVINSRADGWCSISPTSGAAGSATITVTTEPNDTPDDRSASIVIKAGSASKTVKVSQKQKDALTVTSSKFEVTADGGEIEIGVKANIDFSVEIEESAKSWVTHHSTRAMKASTLIMEVDENDGAEKRKANISISGNGLKETITIYQEGAEPIIVLSQNEYTIPTEGETITVEVKSNVDVMVEIPKNASWITENTTRGISTNTYYFDIETNEEYNQRTAEIKFTNKANNLSEVVKITQTQKDALVVAKDSYTVDSDGDQIEIEVGHNVDFDVEISTDWITQEQTRAFTTEMLVFNVAKNPTNDNREGTITFKSKDGALSQTVKVYQAQEDALVISKKDIMVNSESGTLSFEIQTNVDFTVSNPNVSWLRTVQTRGLTSYTLHYEYDANTTYDSREAQIIVTNTRNNKSETITITQAQKDAIVLAKTEYEFGVDGGELDFEIQTNVDVTVNISSGARSWIEHISTRALESKTLHFNVAACADDENREGTITISGGNATQTITVKQGGRIPDNEIWYTSSDGEVVEPDRIDGFGANIVSNTYKNGKGVIKFDGPVTSIGEDAFYYCSRLTEITIPNSVTSIGEWAFYYCSRLTKITIPNSVTSIGENAFERCSRLTEITIPNRVTSIGSSTFYKCSSLTEITIPNSVTSIGELAFADCSSLTNVFIGNSVTRIGNAAFADCSSLQKFYGKFAEDNGRCLIKDGVLIAYAEASGTEYTIPNSVTSIGYRAFAFCRSLTEITIPNSVTSIGEYAFYYCISLKSVYCRPATPPAIGSYAFSNNASGCKIYVPAESFNKYCSEWRYYRSDIVSYKFD